MRSSSGPGEAVSCRSGGGLSLVDDHVFFLVTPEDLIISKLDWARDTRSEVQLADVRNRVASVPDLDRPYLALWTERLGLERLYREAGG